MEMKSSDSKKFRLSKRDIRSTIAYAVIIIGPQISLLIPEIKDVLFLYMPLEWVVLSLSLMSIVGVMFKKWATDYSVRNK